METNNHYGERGGKRAVFCSKSWTIGLRRNCVTLCSIYRSCFWKVKHRQHHVRTLSCELAYCRALSLAFNSFIRELANLSITLAGREDQVIAFAAYYDHPVVEGVDPALWEQWLHCNYNFPQANVRWWKRITRKSIVVWKATKVYHTPFQSSPSTLSFWGFLLPNRDLCRVLWQSWSGEDIMHLSQRLLFLFTCCLCLIGQRLLQYLFCSLYFCLFPAVSQLVCTPLAISPS